MTDREWKAVTSKAKKVGVSASVFLARLAALE